MLEYFSYKKYKKNKEDKEAKPAEPTTVLKPEDEVFLEELLSQHDSVSDDDAPPPLPPRVYALDLDFPSDTEAGPSNAGPAPKEEEASSSVKAEEKKKPGRLSLLFTKQKQGHLKPDDAEGSAEVERERKDITRVLDRLNLSAAANNTVIAYSKESSELLQRFTQIFKDIVSGAPSAYDDLTKLIEDRDGTISKLFDKLPSSLRKLVTQLPEKLTHSLGPELLAAAAEAQGLKAAATAAAGGGAMKGFFKPSSIMDLVKKPGAVVAMLKAIVNVLKTRWPAFMGMNVIWSVALSLLLVVLWYCHKRGREERLQREKEEQEKGEASPDRQDLPAEQSAAASSAIDTPELAPAAD